MHLRDVEHDYNFASKAFLGLGKRHIYIKVEFSTEHGTKLRKYMQNNSVEVLEHKWNFSGRQYLEHLAQMNHIFSNRDQEIEQQILCNQTEHTPIHFRFKLKL